MRVRLRDRLRYWFDGTMARGTPALIGLLGLASVALILSVTVLVMVLAPDDAGDRPLKAAWLSLLRTLDPGTMGGDHGSVAFLALMLVVTLGGIFIVSALVGILSTGLNARLAELRKGRSRVVERGHTIILGWSDEIFTIIAELAKAADGERACAVILAERDKVEMEDEIRAHLHRPGIKVVCRTGVPTEPIDLEITSPDAANAIVIPAPAVADPDIQVIKTLLALHHRAWLTQRPSVVAVISHSSNMPAAILAGGPGVELIDAEDLTARLVVQSRRQAGLSIVCNEILSYDGNEIYLHDHPAMAGRGFADAQLEYDAAVLLGLRHADGTVSLNPPPQTVIERGDQAIVLAPSRSRVQLAKSRPPLRESAIATPTNRPEQPDSTLVLGWNHRGDTIVRLLDRYATPGSALHVVALAFDAATLPGPAELTRLNATGAACDPTQRATLEALEPHSYQHVIVLADDGMSRGKADSRTLVTLLHLRDMKERGRDGYTIVSELNDDANRRLAQITRADDFVVGRRMISLLLVQLSQSPHLNAVVAELFEARGANIYLEPAGDYLTPGVEANFATVIAATAGRGETAIGLRLHAESAEAPAYGIHLNPDKAEPITLDSRDKVIVLATRQGPVAHGESAPETRMAL